MQELLATRIQPIFTILAFICVSITLAGAYLAFFSFIAVIGMFTLVLYLFALFCLFFGAILVLVVLWYWFIPYPYVAYASVPGWILSDFSTIGVIIIYSLTGVVLLAISYLTVRQYTALLNNNKKIIVSCLDTLNCKAVISYKKMGENNEQ